MPFSFHYLSLGTVLCLCVCVACQLCTQIQNTIFAYVCANGKLLNAIQICVACYWCYGNELKWNGLEKTHTILKWLDDASKMRTPIEMLCVSVYILLWWHLDPSNAFYCCDLCTMYSFTQQKRKRVKRRIQPAWNILCQKNGTLKRCHWFFGFVSVSVKSFDSLSTSKPIQAFVI